MGLSIEGWVLVAVLAGIVLLICMLLSQRGPKTSRDQIDGFKRRLPTAFRDYAYSHDGTALALNAGERKLVLNEFGTEKVYKRSDLVEITGKIDGQTLFKLRKGGAPYRIDPALSGRLASSGTQKRSGIFIRVADVSAPNWQIRFADANQMQRCVVALQQFLDDKLEKAAPAPRA